MFVYIVLFHRSKIVLVAIGDEASVFMQNATEALERVGAVDPVPEYRGSFALVGHPEALAFGNDRSWNITQQMAGRGQGPSEINMTIPLSTSCT